MQTHSIISLVTGVLALSFNLLLIPIIIRFSSSMIGQYKYLLLLYTCSATIYALLQILTLPTFHLFSRGYLFYGTTDYFSRPTSVALVVAFASCYLQNLVIIGLSFLYRYGVMCRTRMQRHSTDSIVEPVLSGTGSMWNRFYEIEPVLFFCAEIISWFHSGIRLLLLITTSSFGAFVTTCFVIRMTPEFTDFQSVLHEMVLNETGMNLDEIPYVGGFVYLPTGELNPRLLMTMSGYTFCITVVILVAGFCIRKMLQEIKNAPKTVQIQFHKKLLILLLLQSSFPLLTNALPILLIVICSLFGYTSHYAAEYMGSVLSIAQIVDPILVIVFVKDYRMNLMRIFGLSRSLPRIQESRTTPLSNLNDIHT